MELTTLPRTLTSTPMMSCDLLTNDLLSNVPQNCIPIRDLIRRNPSTPTIVPVRGESERNMRLKRQRQVQRENSVKKYPRITDFFQSIHEIRQIENNKALTEDEGEDEHDDDNAPNQELTNNEAIESLKSQVSISTHKNEAEKSLMNVSKFDFLRMRCC